MAGKTNQKGYRAVALALAFCFFAYIIFSSLAIFSYGKQLQPNIFENIKKDTGLISIALRSLFLLIFMCNITFVFLPAKECLLTFI